MCCAGLVMNCVYIFHPGNTQTAAAHPSPPPEAALSACSNHAVQRRHVFPLCTLGMMSHPQSHVLNLKHLKILTQVSLIGMVLKICLASKEGQREKKTGNKHRVQMEKLPADNG